MEIIMASIKITAKDTVKDIIKLIHFESIKTGRLHAALFLPDCLGFG